MTRPPRNSQEPTEESKEAKKTRKRCDNCGDFFKLPEIQRGSPVRFCKPKCRREFNNNRSGFGKLKELLPKFIAREVSRQLTIEREERKAITIADVEKLLAELDFVDHTELTNEGIELIRRAVKRRRERIVAAAANTRRAIAETLVKSFSPGQEQA